jgi:SSS family solute:Na+ symporter
LLGAIVGTTIWFAAGDPLGIDNIYVAAAIPAAAMLLAGRKSRAAERSDEPAEVDATAHLK